MYQVNMKVGKGLASAIETGEKVTHATKDKLGLSAPDDEVYWISRFCFLADGVENTERNVEDGKNYTEKKADHVCSSVSSKLCF